MVGCMGRTFPCSSAPYGAFSNAALSAPSALPPRNNCRIWPESVCTSEVETGCTAGVRVERSKLYADSGSRASTLRVRQLKSAMLCPPSSSIYLGCRMVFSVLSPICMAVLKRCFHVQCTTARAPLDGPTSRLLYALTGISAFYLYLALDYLDEYQSYK